MLRHACGFKLANDGVDTRTIQAYLGHKSIQHTVRYTELSPTRFKSLFQDWLRRNLAQKGSHFLLMIKGTHPMTPIEGGARKRCVRPPEASFTATRVGPNAPCFFWRGPCFTSPEKIGGLSVISDALALPSLTLGNNVSLPGSFVSLADACHVSSTDLLVWTQISQLSRHSFRPIASGQHPSVVTKHD